jgi:SAM-dependent methyltransferase
VTQPDVPSPIDFRLPSDAAEWAATAMAKRPWRQAFFRSFISELERLIPSDGSVLDLGSGPGFLARAILEALPRVEYTALDFSPPMHALAKERLGGLAARVHFALRDFKAPEWTAGLPSYDAVVTIQAVHELRHKRHVPALYDSVRRLLRPGGVFLVCDHVCGESAGTDPALYMSLHENRQALATAGLTAHEVRHEGGMILYRAQLLSLAVPR